MKKMSTVGWVAFVLVIVGGLNWGLVGFFEYDLVAKLFGGMDATFARVIYSLVGLSALYMLYDGMKSGKEG